MLLLTLAIEVPVALLVLWRQGWRKVLQAALAANLLSHPAFHFLLPRALHPHPLGRFILAGELAVFVLEASIYVVWVRPRPWPLALAAAAAANAASFGIGLLLFPGPG